MKSKKTVTALFGLGAACALLLAGCSSSPSGSASTTPASTPTSATSTPSASSSTPPPATIGTPFAAGATIGISLPQKTSTNWVQAGQYFTTGFQAAGFQSVVEFADSGVTEQQQQIEAMIQQGVKVLVIGAVDGSQLGTQLADAKSAGIPVIAYDRMLTNTPDIDAYVSFDNCQIGNMQGQALLRGLAASQGSSPWNIEVFSGSPDDSNSTPFYQCAMQVLQPKIDDGTLKVPSGQTSQQQTATQGWLASNAQTRMDSLMSGYYGNGTKINGVLSPNDPLARAILASVEAAGQADPVVTGMDAEDLTIQSIAAGQQYQTIDKDPTLDTTEVIQMVQAIQQGQPITFNAYQNNGDHDVPSYLLTPIEVTQANVCTALPAGSDAANTAAATDFCKSQG
ncbi:MAG: sugar-binding protein [Propionibacteriaceae bacterium]|nr:sugar-binding protein [Propionibacteriaceae bacterium]